MQCFFLCNLGGDPFSVAGQTNDPKARTNRIGIWAGFCLFAWLFVTSVLIRMRSRSKQIGVFEQAEVLHIMMENSGLGSELVLLMQRSNHFFCAALQILCVCIGIPGDCQLAI